MNVFLRYKEEGDDQWHELTIDGESVESSSSWSKWVNSGEDPILNRFLDDFRDQLPDGATNIEVKLCGVWCKI